MTGFFNLMATCTTRGSEAFDRTTRFKRVSAQEMETILDQVHTFDVIRNPADWYETQQFWATPYIPASKILWADAINAGISHRTRLTPRDGIITDYHGVVGVLAEDGTQWVCVGHSSWGTPDAVSADGCIKMYLAEEFIKLLQEGALPRR